MFSTLPFKNKRLMASITYLLFLLYILISSNLLFFSSYRRGVREMSYDVFRYNLIPFETIMNYLRASSYMNTNIVVMNLIGNILAFMPLGFFLPLLFKRYLSFWRTIVFVFWTTSTVECLQFIFRVGSFDVDDLILNTIGGVLGYMIFRIMFSLARTYLRG